jgi:1,4-dihydroxy-2-naphthoate polyprenyltransferase
MATTTEWIAASRPRTLSAAVAPVAVGVAVAHAARHVSVERALLSLVVSVAVQVGTNYANDYADGKRGTDEIRVGPVRLVASGLAPAPAVRRAAFLAFGIAGVAGLVVALQTSLWLLAVGVACIAAGWFYTGGPRPYGYAGYGEAFCFVFFGLVAVEGTVYATSGHLAGLGFLAACPVGLLTVALLVVNNLRDIPTDGPVGKRTLAVVLGAKRTRLLYAGCVLVPFLLLGVIAISRPAALLALVALVPSVVAVKTVMRGAAGRELIPVLGMTGGLQLLFSVLLAVGIAW